MACHKILIDYSEYVRLKKYEARYEQAGKDASQKKGTGADGLVAGTTNELRTPLIGTTGSITLPPSADLTIQDKLEEGEGKSMQHSTIDIAHGARQQNRKWYYLGIPKPSTP